MLYASITEWGEYICLGWLTFLILFFTRNQVPQIIIRIVRLIYLSLKAVRSLCDQKFKNRKFFSVEKNRFLIDVVRISVLLEQQPLFNIMYFFFKMKLSLLS